MQSPYVARVRREVEEHEGRDWGGVDGPDLHDWFQRETGTEFLPAPGDYAKKPTINVSALFSALSPKGLDPRRKRIGDAGDLHKKARAWRGADAVSARAAGDRWICQRCGPVGQPLHGDDLAMHCPELDCDEVVDACLPEGETRTRTERERTMSKANRKPRICKRCKASFEPPGPGNHRYCDECKIAKATAPPPIAKASTPAKTKKAQAKARAIDGAPGRACRNCGCTDTKPCEFVEGEFCEWVEQDLCSICADSFVRDETDASYMLDEARAIAAVAEVLAPLFPDQRTRILEWARAHA